MKRYISGCIFAIALLGVFGAPAAIAAPPVPTTEPASEIGITTAKLEGKVDPEGKETYCRFDYLTDVQYDENIANSLPGFEGAGAAYCEAALNGTGAQTVALTATGLSPDTAYHARFAISNEEGEAADPVGVEFTTDPIENDPVATVDPATGVGFDEAQISGQIDPEGGNENPGGPIPIGWELQLSTTPGEGFGGVIGGAIEGADAVADDPISEGPPGQPIEANLEGLVPNTAYYYRLVAYYAGKEAVSSEGSFTTETRQPLIQGTSVSDVTTSSATLHAEIEPGGAPTTFHFEYLTLSDYEANEGSFAGAEATPESLSIGLDNTYHPVEAGISGLQPDTPYRFRIVATNEKSPAGGTPGPVRSLRTAATPTGGGADSCPNAAVRAQQDSQFLPECRAYEIVNKPGVDEGEANRVPSISDDGEAVAYSSVLPGDDSFGGGISSISVARRGPNGWTSISADPKTYGSLWEHTGGTEAYAFSGDFTKALLNTALPASPTDEDVDDDFYLVDVGQGTAASMTPDVLTFPFKLVGATPDLGRIVYYVTGNAVEAGIYATSDGTSRDLLSIDESGNRLGGAVPAGSGADRGLGVGVGLGAHQPFVERGGSHAVSDDSQRLYFYAGVVGDPAIGQAGRLYLNDHGVSKEISAFRRIADPGEETPARAQFISASHDGSTAYFNTNRRLTDVATPGGGIYRYEAPTDTLTLVTPDAGGPAGLRLGGAIASDDQSHIYFTSTSDLASGATAGERNAYVWTASGGVRFIATVGESDLFSRVTPDGSFALVLSSASIDGAPTNGLTQVYRYDYAAQELTCVSCRLDGSLSQGTAQIEGQSGGIPNNAQNHNRALSFDGRVVFASTDRLVSGDETTAQDVYIYNDGKVRLLSSGSEPTDSFAWDLSDDGRHVFITSRAALVPGDRDPAEFDVYDVAVGGGFLEATTGGVCEGEACRAASSAPPGAVNFPSSSFVGPSNPKPCAKGKVRRNGRCVKRHKHRRRHKGHKHKQRDANAKGRTGR